MMYMTGVDLTVFALDPATGKLDPGFGKDGVVTLRDGIERKMKTPGGARGPRAELRCGRIYRQNESLQEQEESKSGG